MNKRNCEYCNNEFLGRDTKNVARHCSEHCQKDHWRTLNIDRDRARKAAYYLARKKKLESKPCVFCQKEFQPKRKDAITCSNICSMAKWRSNNKEHIKQDQERRYHSDIGRKLSTCLRSRLNKALKGNIKSAHTMELIGCTVEELKKHIESQFEPWMNWSNHGVYNPDVPTWHIDHVVPMSAFDLSSLEQQKRACSYSNLRPLLAKKNLEKGNR
jgi:hypothetical protein